MFVFMRRHGFSLRRKTTMAQKDPSFLVERLVTYVDVRRLQKCPVVSTLNGWMNEELTLDWSDEVLWQYSFNRHLLASDSYEAHMTR